MGASTQAIGTDMDSDKQTQGEVVHVQDFVKGILDRVTSTEGRAANDDATREFWAKRRSAALRDLRKQYREGSSLKGAMLSSTFDAFCVRGPLQKHALHVAQKFVSHLPGVGKGLMLWGPTGRGKSHLLKAILIAAIELPEPVRVLYIPCSSLGSMVRSEREVFDNLTSYQVVAVDDIEKGLGGDSPAWAREAVKGLIDVADREKRPVLVSTSEFPLKTFTRPDGAEVTGHDEHLPDWLVGRLSNLFYWQEIDGPNWREIEGAEVPWWVE